MCFLSDWSRADIISLFALIVSSLTLFLGYIAFKRLLVQEAKKEQLKIVSQLVNDMSNSRVQLTRLPKDDAHFPAARIWDVNIFDFARNSPNADKDGIFIIATSLEETELQTVFKYLSNPLLPYTIARSIALLRSIECFSNRMTISDVPVFIFGKFSFSDNQQLNSEPQLCVKGGMTRVIKDSKYIQETISKWFKKHGVKEINNISLKLRS